MAVAEAQLAQLFNRQGHEIIDHHTYFMASDGDMMEGISHEAASFAGHAKLGKLIGFYDDNHITIEGNTALTFSDDTGKRFQAYHWHVQHVEDANDLDALDKAIVAAKEVHDQPSLIIVRSHIGFGSPNKHDTAEAHGSPLGVDEIKLTKENLGYPSQEPFYVAPEALEYWRTIGKRGLDVESEWQKKYDAYRNAHPDDAAELKRRLDGELLDGWEQLIPAFTAENGAVASRAASGVVINAIASKVPELVGGSADLASSTNTIVKGAPSFGPDDHSGRNFHFGIREHGMAAIMNGMAVHGGFVPYGATFLIFSEYMRPAVRLSAIMNQHVI
jgi:transketolase